MNSGNDVTALPRKLMPWEKQCVHDIVDICKAEGIPVSFGMRHYHILKVLYVPTRAIH